MSSSFTPGPWTATPYGGVMPVGGKFLVASCGGKSGLYRDHEANARLIAAAPELLEALQQCFDYPADVFSIGDSEPFTMTITGRHLRLVRAAIQKATAGENE